MEAGKVRELRIPAEATAAQLQLANPQVSEPAPPGSARLPSHLPDCRLRNETCQNQIYHLTCSWVSKNMCIVSH